MFCLLVLIAVVCSCMLGFLQLLTVWGVVVELCIWCHCFNLGLGVVVFVLFLCFLIAGLL